MNSNGDSMYRVVARTERPSVDGKPCDFMITRHYLACGSQEIDGAGSEKRIFLQTWADGSITLNRDGKSIFLYDEEWRGVVKAIGVALQDKKDKQEEDTRKWLDATDDQKEFFGVRVDLSRSEVIAALENCPIEVDSKNGETEPSIILDGVRRGLCRTDLKDNVATVLCANKTADEWRAHYLKKARGCYGGRLQELASGPGFSVIDRRSDG